MWKDRRRKNLLAASLTPDSRRLLESRVPLYVRIPKNDRKELEGLMNVFLAEKTFEGCGGFVITDEVKLCIAAQACILLLHRETDFYPDLKSILVFPSQYYTHTVRHLGSGILQEAHEPRLGEASEQGAVALAWDAVCAKPGEGRHARNLVLHEFAHLLDFEDGYCSGAPLLGGGKPFLARKSRRASWTQTFSAEFEKLRAKAQQGEEIYLDRYGMTNPAEFFAVATESFFEQPLEMKAHSPELYEELKDFYQQDPARWPVWKS